MYCELLKFWDKFDRNELNDLRKSYFFREEVEIVEDQYLFQSDVRTSLSVSDLK